MSSSEFAGKAVIVTGAAQGIGRTIAEQFIRQGARVLIFDLDAELAMETTRQLSPDGNMAACVGGDVSRREDVHRAVETCIERFGRLDVMVAHAGIADAQPLLEIDDASWQRILDVNLTGVFLCTQEAGRVMARSGGGILETYPAQPLCRDHRRGKDSSIPGFQRIFIYHGSDPRVRWRPDAGYPGGSSRYAYSRLGTPGRPVGARL